MWFLKVDRLLDFLHVPSGYLCTPERTSVLYVRLANWWLKTGSVAPWAPVPFLNNSVLKPLVGAKQGSSSGVGVGEATVAQNRVSEFQQSAESSPAGEGMAADMGNWLDTQKLIKWINTFIMKAKFPHCWESYKYRKGEGKHEHWCWITT